MLPARPEGEFPCSTSIHWKQNQDAVASVTYSCNYKWQSSCKKWKKRVEAGRGLISVQNVKAWHAVSVSKFPNAACRYGSD